MEDKAKPLYYIGIIKGYLLTFEKLPYLVKEAVDSLAKIIAEQAILPMPSPLEEDD